MQKGQPFKWLPKVPFAAKFSKLALGSLFLIFFLDYQPSFSFPPIAQSQARAESQSQSVQAQSLPFEFQLPHPGYLSTSYSSYHPGVDIATGLGMPIKPVAPGRVTEAGYSFWGYGLGVTVDHEQGYRSFYAHMGKIYVKKDQVITKNTTLGEVGLTGHTSGPHTHLELFKDGGTVDPLAVLPKLRDYPTEADFVAINNQETITKKQN